MIGGPQMQMLSDFDFDPGNMVPAMAAGRAGHPQLDRTGRATSAPVFLKLFTFHVAQLADRAERAAGADEVLRLARAGLIDIWTLLGKMEIPNVGEPRSCRLPRSARSRAGRGRAAMQDAITASMTASRRRPRRPVPLDPATGQVVRCGSR